VQFCKQLIDYPSIDNYRFLKDHPSVYIIVINLGLRQEKIDLASKYPYLKNTLEIVVASSNALYVK